MYNSFLQCRFFPHLKVPSLRVSSLPTNLPQIHLQIRRQREACNRQQRSQHFQIPIPDSLPAIRRPRAVVRVRSSIAGPSTSPAVPSGDELAGHEIKRVRRVPVQVRDVKKRIVAARAVRIALVTVAADAVAVRIARDVGGAWEEAVARAVAGVEGLASDKARIAHLDDCEDSITNGLVNRRCKGIAQHASTSTQRISHHMCALAVPHQHNLRTRTRVRIVRQRPRHGRRPLLAGVLVVAKCGRIVDGLVSGARIGLDDLLGERADHARARRLGRGARDDDVDGRAADLADDDVVGRVSEDGRVHGEGGGVAAQEGERVEEESEHRER